MNRTVTSPYDVAEHLRTSEEMAAYLEAYIEEADGDAAFIAKALGDIAVPRACRKSRAMPGCPEKVSTRRFREIAIRPWKRF